MNGMKRWTLRHSHLHMNLLSNRTTKGAEGEHNTFFHNYAFYRFRQLAWPLLSTGIVPSFIRFEKNRVATLPFTYMFTTSRHTHRGLNRGYLSRAARGGANLLPPNCHPPLKVGALTQAHLQQFFSFFEHFSWDSNYEDSFCRAGRLKIILKHFSLNANSKKVVKNVLFSP